MDSDFQVGECACCKECRRLGIIPVEIGEISLNSMTKLVSRTGKRVGYQLCGLCSAQVRTGGLLVTENGVFILENGKHYISILREKTKHTHRL